MIPLFHIKSDSNGTTYEVYYSWRKGWLCQCMSYYMSVCNKQEPTCKHIAKVKAVLHGDLPAHPEIPVTSS
jgi:hypothetical protein